MAGTDTVSNVQQAQLAGLEEITEGDVFTRIRYKRHLQHRWRCNTKGHAYCFTKADSLHMELTNDNLDEWAAKMHDCEATFLAPPESMLPSDAHFLNQTVPSMSIVLQKHFHFRPNPSLSDLRSWHNSLSASSLTSVNPGPGYLSGKAIKWVGEKILDALTPLEIRRRMWLIERFVRHLEGQPAETRWKWLVQRKKSVNRLVDDLLELSADEYKPKYREASITHGIRFSKCLETSDYEDEGAYWFLSANISPLKFIGDGSCSVDSLKLSATVRDILLQESMAERVTDGTSARLVTCALNAIHYGSSAESRRNAFELIHQLYFVPVGRQELQRLGRPGGILENLAAKVFNGGIEHHQELACAVQFFVDYADDHPAFRPYVLAPNGLSFILRINDKVQHLPIDWDAISWPCRCIGTISSSPWVIPALVDWDICNVFVRVLLAHHKSGRPDVRVDYVIVWTLRNVVVSGDPVRRAAHDALTGEALAVLRDLWDAAWGIKWMGKNVRGWIADIFGRGTGGSVEIPKSRKAPTDLVFRI